MSTRSDGSWNTSKRERLKKGIIKGAFAGPNQTFPINGPEDVGNAWDLAGKAGDPDEVRRNILSIAKENGWESGLPATAKTWKPSKMDAKKAGKKPSKAQKAKLKKVFHEWKAGTLHSGSKNGQIVKHPEGRKQGIAIALSESGMSRKDSKVYRSTFLTAIKTGE
jgi:hypothetical protein